MSIKYIVNERIIYTPENNTLEERDGQQAPIVLTATLNRLLVLLIKNNEITLSREMLLKQVWENYGQVSSNSNLTNGISFLRKAFYTLGEQDIIVTEPKLGLRFSAKSLVLSSDCEAEKEDKRGDFSTKLSKKKSGTVFDGLLIILMLSAAFMAIHSWMRNLLPEAEVSNIASVGQCKVKFVDGLHQEKMEKTELKTVDYFFKMGGVNCNEKASVYYYSNAMITSFAAKKNSVIFFGYCPDNNKIQCENLYENHEVN
ncbi:winged helix-turn-helix domain-containing protein [Serratia marcescens]